jgi:hypothetical protein
MHAIGLGVLTFLATVGFWAIVLVWRGARLARRNAENRMLAEIILRENSCRSHLLPAADVLAFGQFPKAKILQVGLIVDKPDGCSVIWGWAFDPTYPHPRAVNELGRELYWGYTLAELREIAMQPSEFVDQ